MREFWQYLSQQCIDESRKRLAGCRVVLGGFNLNVDMVKHLKQGEFEQLAIASGITDNEPGQTILQEKSDCFAATEQYTAILDERSFVESLAKCIKTGNSIEIPIKERYVFQWLNDKLAKSSKCKLGGQPAFMALAACAFVPKIILLGWPIPKQFAKLMPNTNNNIYIVVFQNDTIYVKPIHKCKNLSGHNYANWVIEFPADLQICTKKFKFKSPRAGRFIANWFPRNDWMKPGTSSHIDSSFAQVTHAFLSGCQLLCPNEKNKNLWRKQVLEFAKTIHNLLDKTRCQAVHYEIGNIRSPSLRKELIKNVLSSGVNSVGCNEDELAAFLEVIGKNKLSDRIRKNISIVNVYQGAFDLAQYCKLRRLHVHTWDFHISVSQTEINTGIAERDALLFGAIMGAAKTYTDIDIRDEHVEQGLNTPFSKKGITLVEELHKNPVAIGTCIKEGIFQANVDTLVCIVPGRVKTGLKSTLGLGDTLSSMAFLVSTGDMSR